MANFIVRQIPNSITCCNLISGCIAIHAAFQGNYYGAFIFIIIGAVFDFFDGMTARLLKVSSPIGKELDSLADVVTFGVAPSAMLFHFFNLVSYPEFLEPIKQIIPYSAFLIAAFSALRLAKFNLDTRQTSSFIGVPTPANTLFWASIIVGYQNFLTSDCFNALYLIAAILLSCYLLIAELPLFALKFKNWSWKDNKIKYIFVLSSIIFIIFLGVGCFAAIIAWYILLSLLANKCSSH